MAAELLLEIGTEEIPSDYLENGLKEMKRLGESCLKENRIEMTGGLYTCGTPRRLVLIGKAVADKQKDAVREITGPPKRAAFDKEGNPTKAASGFAKRHGVSVDELGCLETPKGEYIYVKHKIPGRPTIEVLSEVLSKLIADIPWPKSMRWGSGGFSFVRPIHWILALFNGEVIPFELAGVRSGNKTRGHRFMAPRIMEIEDLQDYFQKMKESSVCIDQKEREKEVAKIIVTTAKAVSGIPAKDPELLSIVANMVEFPSAICGGFDEAFLNIPDPVLITAMREHQRYFAIRDREGRLMPNFVAVNNTIARDESIVRKGHERVLRARLADAGFFFKEDRKRPLEDRLEDLKEVIYQAELGNSFAKVQRFLKLAQFLAEQVAPEKIDDVGLTARLCKCDLVTEMVMEFPSLQGVIGKEYARLDGHPEEVCLAIHEHYLPVRAGGELPASPIGAIVGLADRMDTIAGCFAIQLEPTGTSDPFALRRHSLAIIRIMEEREWDILLKDFISLSLSILNEEIAFDKGRVFNKVLGFFRERYKSMMLRSGYESDLIEAIISVEFDHINQLRLRIDHLKRFITESKEFESLVLTFKRVTNILKKQEESLTVNPDLFKEISEFKLWEAYQELKDDVYRSLEKRNYFEALNLMMRLRRPVDDLFDGVEILTKDSVPLRDNRVGMLQSLARLFLSLADFSKFSI
ncbi:MAG: glycine--tRNA ligase subunit beta [Deltaproteobacteria bacterium]|nr:glycine--tRNA ligase subunit beta [Deltaproteobacteria bacterium]